MSRLHTTILLLTFFVAFNACKKKTTAPPVSTGQIGNATAVIVNKIQDSVYITLSGHDIATGTLPHIISLTLPPADTLIIPTTDLKNAYRYSYDWHTADYTYSNWFMTDAKGLVPELIFDFYADTTDYLLNINGIQRNEMLICLDGNGISTTWKAVEAYDANGVSVWQAMSEREKFHTFIISKYHTSKHFSIDTNNKSKITNLSFSLDISQPPMWLKVTQVLDSYVLSNNLTPIVSLASSANDTLYYSRFYTDMAGKLIYPEPYYKLARQSVER